ncbi:hypothetical protein BpHYR1_006722 [Brachionus plicatilis]|uniref:Uncharacterized protein n=1 Tax=Brachionus plicatilis TaxID=10195 RepID=A0A3M7RRE6_BRAPC|nr:hypothetical protein BpHYR1_006722 [Brachionus plicatilis]
MEAKQTANFLDHLKKEKVFQGSSEWQSLLFSPHGCNMIKICINYMCIIIFGEITNIACHCYFPYLSDNFFCSNSFLLVCFCDVEQPLMLLVFCVSSGFSDVSSKLELICIEC